MHDLTPARVNAPRPPLGLHIAPGASRPRQTSALTAERRREHGVRRAARTPTHTRCAARPKQSALVATVAWARPRTPAETRPRRRRLQCHLAWALCAPSPVVCRRLRGVLDGEGVGDWVRSAKDLREDGGHGRLQPQRWRSLHPKGLR